MSEQNPDHTAPEPVPAKKPRRPLSEAELEARRRGGRAAAAARSPEGRAAVSRNGWKHGRYSAVHKQHFGLGATSVAKLFGKPCRTTCPVHPDNPDRSEAPCSLVLDGITRAGGSCMDKTIYANAFMALTDAMSEGGDQEGVQAMMAAEVAGNMELLHALRRTILEDGLMISLPAISRDGEVILNPDTGKAAVGKVQANPALGPAIKLFEVLGINLPELLATPRARQRLADEDAGVNALQQMLGNVMARAQQRRAGQGQGTRPAMPPPEAGDDGD